MCQKVAYVYHFRLELEADLGSGDSNSWTFSYAVFWQAAAVPPCPTSCGHQASAHSRNMSCVRHPPLDEAQRAQQQAEQGPSNALQNREPSACDQVCFVCVCL